MIQTGDSTGQASDDERKILANTLFYLYQISQQTTAKDASFYDIDAPNKPTLVSSSVSEGKMTIDISSVDNKTEYEYYISANPENTKSENVLSNIRRHETLSGLAGFVVEVNNSSEPSSDLIKYDENNENILNLNLADSNGNAKVTVSPNDLSEPQYIHIFAVDNANNVSEELIVPFSDTELVTNIETDKKLYSFGDTVSIDTYTVSLRKMFRITLSQDWKRAMIKQNSLKSPIFSQSGLSCRRRLWNELIQHLNPLRSPLRRKQGLTLST